MPVVRMPDGTQVRFPDNMPPAEIQRMILSRFPQALGGTAQAQPATAVPGAGMVAGDIIGQMAGGGGGGRVPQPSPQVAHTAQSMAALPDGLSNLPSAVRSGANALRTGTMEGITGNFSDEINATLMTPVEMLVSGTGNPAEAWTQAYERNRVQTQEDVAGNPMAAGVGNVLGALITGGTMAQGGASLLARAQPTIASMAGRGAAEGALYGAVYGAGGGESLQDRVIQAGVGAAMGGGLGGVTGGVAGGIAQASRTQVPSIAQLRQQASDLYTQARNSGITFPQSVVRTAADDIAARAISEGLDPTLHPGATAALRRLQEAGAQGMTAQEAQTIRRVLRAAAQSPTNPDQARIAGIMVDLFDQQITGSIPQLAAANTLYGQARRGHTIENAFIRARDKVGVNYNNAGMVTALRREFDRILGNANLRRGFSDAELDAIRAFVRGGPMENFFRSIGRFAPTGPISGAAAFGVPATMGYMLGNPVAGAALGVGAAGAGAAARGIGNSIAISQANRISEMVRSGLPMATPPLPLQIGAGGLMALEGQQAPYIPSYLVRSTAQ